MVSAMRRELRPNAFAMNCVGHHSQGLWRHPRDRSVEYRRLDYWVELAPLVSIPLVGHVSHSLGWTAAFTMLAVGPFLGCVAMVRLRTRSEAIRLAGGRR
jgi:hypothetical protein